MITNKHLQTYVYDILGMSPVDAVAYLKTCLLSSYFRSMRIIREVKFDPEIHRAEFKSEEHQEGRVTVELKEGKITNA